jgi:E3 ubiquitin-protein ligase RNF5
MDQARRICPICRTKIDRPPPATGKFGPKSKGFYPLELKLMTRKTLGRTSGQSSQGA